ncbi:AAA family ATPase,putative [Plasmodium sp. gorilla clade G3]|nr:AAA family ATPase,putative [Plasmodium sp. gorilla clade G3]
MSTKEKDKVIENFCVYDHSNKSFSYLKVKKREIKKEKYENEYERLVNRKCMYNYEWIKNLSYKECIDYIIKNSFNNLKKEKYVDKYGKKYKKNISSLCSIKQNEECSFINNTKFLKEEKNIRNALHCININKGKYKPQLFVDKIFKMKNRYENIIYKHEDMIREQKLNDHKKKKKKSVVVLPNKKKVFTDDDNNKNKMNMKNMNMIKMKNMNMIKMKNMNMIKMKNMNMIKMKNMNMIKMKNNFEVAYSHPFDMCFRKKCYEKISRIWLKNFIKKNGKVHKKLAKKLIKCLIIKNFIIFDVELWNIFLKKNIMNHFNTNLYFLTGKIGNMKRVFLNDIFSTFPFLYKNDHIFMIDIRNYEDYTIVCDYRYLMDPMYLNTNKEYNIKKKLKKKKKKISLFKMLDTFDDIKNKEKYSKLINLQIYNDKLKNKIRLCEEKNNNNSVSTNDNNIKYYYVQNENYKNVDIINMKHDNIMSIEDKFQSDSSYELINFKTNQFKKKKFSDDKNYNHNYEKKLYVQKVLYPYYYELVLKEKLITDINMITSYDPLNFNLEYILIHFTRQAIIKQFVWKRKMYKWLKGIFNKSQREQIMKKLKKKVNVNLKRKNDDDENFYMNKKMNMNLGLDLFNGGISFLLIKNLEYINNFPIHKKNCIIFLLLKYIFIWKNMNLNAHMFIISSSSSISQNNNNNNNVINNINIYNNSSDNITSLFNKYINNYFVFVFPNFLNNINRYQLLIHLFKKYKLYYCKNEIKELAKITNNFHIDNIIKLFEDEYRERIIDHLKRKKKKDTSQEIITKNSCIIIKDIFQKARKGKNQFFSKSLNLQQDSHIYIHMHEIEMYKKKKYEMFSKNGIFENYGFNEVIGEEELISQLKNQIVSKFNMQESKNIGFKKIHMCDIENDNVNNYIKANGINNTHENNKSHYNNEMQASSPMWENISNLNELDTVGILLHGKSGSGKSFIAKKIVEECNCNSVIINCSNIFNKVMGESEKFLNEIFEYCINKLQPCILLFDGIETICYKEDCTIVENFTTRLKLCFYENIDKIHYEKKWKRNPCLLLIIATTNDINNIDDNLLTHYRFKYIYQATHFQYWKEQDIYKLFYKCLKSNNIESIDFLYSQKFKHFVDEHIIKVQYKLSPLYIYNLCTYALTYRLRNALKGNENELDVEDFYESIKRMKY